MSEYRQTNDTIEKLIEEQKHIDSIIFEAHQTTLGKPSKIDELRINLLQRKKQKIRDEIEQMCTHEWGDNNYGYIECTMCQKIRNTRHW